MKKKKENLHCKQPFRYFDVFPVRPPQKFQVQDKIPTIRSLFPGYLLFSYEYAVKLQTRLLTTFHQLTLHFIMLQNGQTYFKNLAV